MATTPKVPYTEDQRNLQRAPKPADMEAPHPLYCVWEITLKCDLGCRHCGSRAGDERAGELSTEQCLDVARQLVESGVREVTMIGGEVYMRDDWDQIARYLAERDVLVSLVTGALGMNQERVDRAQAAGIRGISVSLDGLERTHDALRGRKGSFRAAVEACGRITKSSMRLSFNSQLNRLSVPELPALADLLVELGGKAWQLQLTTPMGHAADRPDLLLQPYDYLELFPILVWIKQTKLKPNEFRLFLGNNIGYFGPYERFLRYGAELEHHWSGCSAGQWALGIEADGKLKGCPSLPSAPYTGGNLKERGLEDIWRNAPELTQFAHRTRSDLWGYCKECYYADVCKGGCNWVSSTLLGRNGNNPYCIHRALQFEAQGLRERVVKVEDAQGKPFDFGRFEIVVEPLPDAVEPLIVGVPLERVQGATPRDAGLWSPKELSAVLRVPRA